ncbi:myb-related protein MYBAS2-like [Typha angustifolia]|uniref:myb-related protein MYBAS2-like n=1 Tax=Typha angustifolia TaxID=59011 RepID=UPI003C30296E
MVTVREETRKGPWTEQEDLQLVCIVRLFGERRWDFIAKVSGLNRTGKSCRLRWVNYLHPGLKRGRMTPQEERLILDLHSRWGNRWSRIARRLPGRTDNEIKNYWRTHMRKKAQERKGNLSPSSSSSSLTYQSEQPPETSERERCELISTACGGSCIASAVEERDDMHGYSMDQIWNEIDTSEGASGVSCDESKDNISCQEMLTPVWECCLDSLWRVDDEELKMLPPPSG